MFVLPKQRAPHLCTYSFWRVSSNLQSLVAEHHHQHVIQLCTRTRLSSSVRRTRKRLERELTPVDGVDALALPPEDNCWIRYCAAANACSAEPCRCLACTASFSRLANLAINSSVVDIMSCRAKISGTMCEIRTQKERRIVRATLAETTRKETSSIHG